MSFRWPAPEPISALASTMLQAISRGEDRSGARTRFRENLRSSRISVFFVPSWRKPTMEVKP
jgi:hypothetical protein